MCDSGLFFKFVAVNGKQTVVAGRNQEQVKKEADCFAEGDSGWTEGKSQR